MPIDLLMVRDDDIPRLVSQNIADLGIVGENVVSEKQLSDSSLKSKIIELNYNWLNTTCYFRLHITHN